MQADQISTFQDRGLIKLPGFFAPEAIAPMRAKVWEFLEERDGIKADTPATWPAPPNTTPTKLAKLNTHPVFDGLDNADLQTVLAALVPGRAVHPFPGVGQHQCLITFPNATDWQLPHSLWHTDRPHEMGNPHPQGLQTFICLDEVAPQGGGTLVLTGSHKVKLGGGGQIASGNFKKLFGKQSAYAAALFDETTPNRNALLETPGSYEDIALQPIELTGQAGDLYIMDMRLMHTLSPNAGSTPRLVVTQRFVIG